MNAELKAAGREMERLRERKSLLMRLKEQIAKEPGGSGGSGGESKERPVQNVHEEDIWNEPSVGCGALPS